MEHQKKYYMAGYCIAMLMMAAVAIRMVRIPEQQSVLEIDEPPLVEETEASGTLSVLSEGKPAYQDLYPDMYVHPQGESKQGGNQEDVIGPMPKKESVPVSETKETVRRIYLTFDDGPSEVTQEVVAALDKVGAKAAFFLIGNELTKEREELVRQMAKEGHIIGIHTYSHQYKDIYSSVESFLEDFYKAYKRVYEVTGVQPVYFRFPWGSINCYNKEIRGELIAEMERRGFRFFDWNVSAEDSVGKPTEYSVLHNVVDFYPKFRNAVVLMHDSNSNKITARVLPEILGSIQENGYEFGTINQMEEPYQWPKSITP